MTGGELARREPASLVDWAVSAREAHQIAESLAQTSFVPRSMQGRPDEVTGAILMGRELGLEPMAALRSINVIEGTPSLTAAGMRGLAQSLGHSVYVEESTDTRAVVCGRRKGSPDTERVVWTVDRAKKAGLAGKQNWTRHPAAMLVARATAEVVRRIASDALMGMPRAAEEIADEPDADEPQPVAVTPERAAPAKPKPRTLKRNTAAIAPVLYTADPEPPAEPEPAEVATPPAAEPEPAEAADQVADGEGGSPPEPEQIALDEPEPPPAEPEPEPDLMTEPQRKALMAVYRKKGGDRDDRVAHASAVLGRDVTSFNELTKREAMVLLDALVADDAEDGYGGGGQ